MSVKATDSLYVIPEHFGESLSTLAGKTTPADEKKAISSISRVCQEAIQKAGYNVLLSDAEMESRVALLKNLRERCQPAVENLQGEVKTLRKSDPKILGLFTVPLSYVTGLGTTFNRNNLISADRKLQAQQKELETKRAVLAKDVEAVKALGLVRSVKPATVENQELKEHMPPLRMLNFEDGLERTNYTMVFNALLQIVDGSVDDDGFINARVQAFGTKEGIVPPNIEGKDIDLLKLMATSRFGEMKKWLEAYCKKPEFRMSYGVAYFVPGEMSDQKIQVRRDGDTVTVTLEAKMPLIHLENAETFAHITARSETVLGSNKATYTFSNLQPTAAINSAHCEKIKRVFTDKPAIKAPEGA